MQAHLYVYACVWCINCMCVLVVVEVVVEGAGLAQTGFLPVVTMVSSGFAFRRWKEEGE